MNCEFENGIRANIAIVPVARTVIERISVNTNRHTYFVNLPFWENIDSPGKLVHAKDSTELEIISTTALTDSTERFETNGFHEENRSFFEMIRNREDVSCDLDTAVQSVEIEDIIRNSGKTYDKTKEILI